MKDSPFIDFGGNRGERRMRRTFEVGDKCEQHHGVGWRNVVSWTPVEEPETKPVTFRDVCPESGGHTDEAISSQLIRSVRDGKRDMRRKSE